MSLMRMMGIVLVIAGFGAYGLMAAQSLRRRVDQIKELRMAMGFLEKEITYLQTPLSIALERTGRCVSDPVGQFFRLASRNLKDRQGVTAYEAWQAALEYLQKSSDLKPDDLELVKNVGTQIGLSGPLEQEKLFHLVQEELKIQEERARESEESGKKLRSYGGFILGMTVVLLLL